MLVVFSAVVGPRGSVPQRGNLADTSAWNLQPRRDMRSNRESPCFFGVESLTVPAWERDPAEVAGASEGSEVIAAPPVERGHVTASPSLAGRGRRVSTKLRAGAYVMDSLFDSMLPLPARSVAAMYWTPIRVATRAAQLLAEEPTARILDVGAGVGKFCLVGALTTQARFFGIEQRESLVAYAQKLALMLGVDDASFELGRFDALDPKDFDGFYFYNPFEESRFSKHSQYDDTVVLSEERFVEDVAKAQRFLAEARVGAKVVTYNGMGGELPWSYSLKVRETMGCTLELWQKEF